MSIIIESNEMLVGRRFLIPKGVKDYLSALLLLYDGDKTVGGYKRLKNLLNTENGLEYNELKRIKNFFDNYQGTKNSIEYVLNGGDIMRGWVNMTLNNARRAVDDYKMHKKALGFKNVYRRHHRKNRPKNNYNDK